MYYKQVCTCYSIVGTKTPCERQVLWGAIHRKSRQYCTWIMREKNWGWEALRNLGVRKMLFKNYTANPNVYRSKKCMITQKPRICWRYHLTKCAVSAWWRSQSSEKNLMMCWTRISFKKTNGAKNEILIKNEKVKNNSLQQ